MTDTDSTIVLELEDSHGDPVTVRVIDGGAPGHAVALSVADSSDGTTVTAQADLTPAMARQLHVALADAAMEAATLNRERTQEQAAPVTGQPREVTHTTGRQAGKTAASEAYRLGVQDAQQIVAGEDTIEWARDAHASHASLAGLIEGMDDLVDDPDDVNERLAEHEQEVRALLAAAPAEEDTEGTR